MVYIVNAQLVSYGVHVVSSDDLQDSFRGYNTLTKLVDLIEQAPQMMETILYTIFNQPLKVSKQNVCVKVLGD